MNEHQHQVELLRRLRAHVPQYRALSLMYAIPNGARVAPSQAKKLKAEGLKAGVFDLCLPVPSAPWHGLYLEMKALRGSPSVEQREFGEALGAMGYAAVVCRGWEAALEVTLAYVRGELDLDSPSVYWRPPNQGDNILIVC